MRIGVDALAVQSPQHGRRGIGRYGKNLIDALRAAPGGHEILVHAHEGLPAGDVPSATRLLAPDLSRGEATAAHRMDRLARENPDRLDAFLVISPFEHWAGYAPPPTLPAPDGFLTATIVHDLIPLSFQEWYLADPAEAAWYRRAAQGLRRADLLLAISESTRDDCIARWRCPRARVRTVGAAGDRDTFTPDRPGPMPAGARATLAALGVDRPFVFSVGGLDPRKNLWGLIDAFALLPEAIRSSHQLVLTFDINWDDRRRVHWYAEERGLGDALVITGAIPDDALLALYRRCGAFCLPSYSEGFGLPILEAMMCGARSSPAITPPSARSPGMPPSWPTSPTPPTSPASWRAPSARTPTASASRAPRALEFSWANVATRTDRRHRRGGRGAGFEAGHEAAAGQAPDRLPLAIAAGEIGRGRLLAQPDPGTLADLRDRPVPRRELRPRRRLGRRRRRLPRRPPLRQDAPVQGLSRHRLPDGQLAASPLPVPVAPEISGRHDPARLLPRRLPPLVRPHPGRASAPTSPASSPTAASPAPPTCSACSTRRATTPRSSSPRAPATAPT